MKPEFIVVFYQRGKKKTPTKGDIMVPYYHPFTGANLGGKYAAAGQLYNENPPITAAITFETKAEAEKAAQDLLDQGFYNVGVFQKLGEFAPAAPTWQEVA